MSLISWLAKANPGIAERKKPRTPFLPDPSSQPNKQLADAVETANMEIGDALLRQATTPVKRRGQYFHYDEEIRALIGKYANEHGVTATSRHFSDALEHSVSPTTVVSIRKAFWKQLKTERDPTTIKTLPTQKRGRPLLLRSDVDGVVIQHLRVHRRAGGTVN